MTDEQIENALDIHKVFGNCKNCSYYYGEPVCSTRLLRDVSDYINRLKAEKVALIKEADENAALAMEQKMRAEHNERNCPNKHNCGR